MRASAAAGRVYCQKAGGGTRPGPIAVKTLCSAGGFAMKTTLRFLICTAIVLATLSVYRPLARADDATDYVNQIYQDQSERDEYLEQVQQTQDYVDQIYQDQAAQDDYLGQLQQTQDYVDQIYQDQQQLDDYLNSIWQND
jgi:hypothetical protein